MFPQVTDQNGSMSQIQAYNYVVLGVGLPILVAALIYYPAEPPTPPSRSAAKLHESAHATGFTWQTFVQTAWATMQSSTFWVLGLAYGIGGGVFGGWQNLRTFTAAVSSICCLTNTSSAVDIMLPGINPNYTQADAGMLGFASSFGTIFFHERAKLDALKAADVRSWQRRHDSCGCPC
jgi:hypothetical protein